MRGGWCCAAGGPVTAADVAHFWHQPPWGILECNADLWFLCLRCVEQLPFLCSHQFGCFSLEGNCWEILFFFKAEKELMFSKSSVVMGHFDISEAQLLGWCCT